MKKLVLMLMLVCSPAFADGAPHSQAFKFLMDMSAQSVANARDYYDCSTGRCERGYVWTSGNNVQWQVIYELDGQSAQAARRIEVTRFGLHMINFNLAKGKLVEQTSDGRVVPQDMTWPDAYNWP